MKVRKTLTLISAATRSSDWRLSFIPFIVACVYLWSSLFSVQFSLSNLGVFLLSVCTTFGFAAFGYFINEFFDKGDDFKAGKLNKLAQISGLWQFGIFFLILMVCFLPWLYLPKNETTYYLIAAEVLCFILYSAPILRLKRSTYLAGILDALYAYLIPGLLSYHTYSLLANQTGKIYPLLFFVAIFFIGYRNIFLHQIKDVLGDQKSGMVSLPKKLGVKQSYLLLKVLYFLEITLIIAFSIQLVFIEKVYAVWAIVTLSYFVYIRADLTTLFKDAKYFALLPVRHVLDILYQLLFPISQLLILIWVDWRWLVILPFHLLFFVNKDFIVSFYGYLSDYLWHKSLRPLISVLFNYPIYFVFKMFGVDLKKEDKSAYTYLKNKFK